MSECVLFERTCCNSFIDSDAVHLTGEGPKLGMMSINITLERVDEIDLYEACETGLKVKDGIRVEYNCLECGAERQVSVAEISRPVKKFLKNNGVVIENE